MALQAKLSDAMILHKFVENLPDNPFGPFGDQEVFADIEFYAKSEDYLKHVPNVESFRQDSAPEWYEDVWVLGPGNKFKNHTVFSNSTVIPSPDGTFQGHIMSSDC